jgi:hypothetical protein
MFSVEGLKKRIVRFPLFIENMKYRSEKKYNEIAKLGNCSYRVTNLNCGVSGKKIMNDIVNRLRLLSDNSDPNLVFQDLGEECYVEPTLNRYLGEKLSDDESQ